MKKIIILCLALFISGLTILSCKKKKDPSVNPDNSGSTDNPASVCIKRIFKNGDDNDTRTELFKYEGAKLVYYNSDIHRSGYSSSREKVEYTYNSDGILSKMTIYSNNGQTQTTTNYEIVASEIVGYTTSTAGLGADDDNYPVGKYYRNANHQVIAYTNQYSSTNKDSSCYSYNNDGKINSTKDYQTGILWRSQENTDFDASGNEATVVYKSYNISGAITAQEEHSTTYYDIKNPIFKETYENMIFGYSVYNFTPYLTKTGLQKDNSGQTIAEYRYTLTHNDSGVLIKCRTEKYNTSTSQWDFVYDYEYEYTCE